MNIFGPIGKNGEYRIKTNFKLRTLYNLQDLVAVTKGRIWAG